LYKRGYSSSYSSGLNDYTRANVRNIPDAQTLGSREEYLRTGVAAGLRDLGDYIISRAIKASPVNSFPSTFSPLFFVNVLSH
jgi:hypothetical protein